MTLDEAINRFRLASRELFNTYFRNPDPYKSWESSWELQEAFQEVEALLFKKLVIEPFKLSNIEYFDSQPRIQVVISGDSAPIMLNREVDSGYWDHPQNRVSNDVTLFFKNFFDFDQLNYRDHLYVCVQVHEWTSHP